MNMAPTRKVVAGGLAAQMAAVGVWALDYFSHVIVPPEIAVAAVGALVTIIQWLVPDRR